MLDKKNKIILIEDHHQALNAWRRQGFKNIPLVHLDAHIDFGFYRAKPLTRALSEAKSLKDLKKQLEVAILYRKHKKDLEDQLNIGNYIYPAERDGIVSRFYWVVPGGAKEFKKSLKGLRNTIKTLKSRDPYPERKLEAAKQKISTLLYGKYFESTYLSAVRGIKNPVLLDIDVDFLLFGSIDKDDVSLTKNLGQRRPWLFPKQLVSLVKTRFSRAVYITIAYSVNGGFTPLEYKFFGDEILLRLQDQVDLGLERIFSLRDEGIKKLSAESFRQAVQLLKKHKGIGQDFKARFLAHLYFWIFKIYWEAKKKKPAKTYYQKAVKADPAYRVRDNNFGPLYLRKNKLGPARAEFEKIIYCDPQDPYALCGLGEVLSRRKRYKQALDKYKQALKINPKEKPALLGLAVCRLKLSLTRP